MLSYNVCTLNKLSCSVQYVASSVHGCVYFGRLRLGAFKVLSPALSVGLRYCCSLCSCRVQLSSIVSLPLLVAEIEITFVHLLFIVCQSPANIWRRSHRRRPEEDERWPCLNTVIWLPLVRRTAEISFQFSGSPFIVEWEVSLLFCNLGFLCWLCLPCFLVLSWQIAL